MNSVSETFPVLWEDNHVIVVFKAPGLLTQGDITGAPSLLEETKSWIKIRNHKPGKVFLGLVHRLDRPARGAVLFAKTSKAASRISALIRNHQMRKIYRVCVEGTLRQPTGAFTDWLAPNSQSQMAIVGEEHPQAQKAQLTYRTISSVGRRYLLEVELVTGRKHQIRVQFGHRGLPVVGDVKYGGTRHSGEGIALMSHSIGFKHPTRDETITASVSDQSVQEFHGFLN